MLDASRLVFVYYTLLESYRRVIESNFSKFISEDYIGEYTAESEAWAMTIKYGIDITKELNNGYWVFRDSNGKIRKPSTFKPVDLSDLI